MKNEAGRSVWSRLGILVFLLVCAVSGLQAQKQLELFRLPASPVLDGLHDSELWALADCATGFVQMEPSPGSRASSISLCYIGLKDETIYLSAVLSQDGPILARETKRDQLGKSDDNLVLLLSPFNDKRSGYGFWINPLGTQCDFRINDDGRSVDVSWDTRWEGHASIGDSVWTLEMAIPLSSIQFDPDQTEWGLNLRRVEAASLESSYWSGQLSDDLRLSQGGILRGVSTGRFNQKLRLYPYASLRYENNDFSNEESGIKPDAGVDLKWQPRSNLTADLTLNPDFATVEGDQERVNLTRYEINYPEKRLFFQEGNEMYKTRIKTFYSRRIGDMVYGAKLNGKSGKNSYNALNARTMSPLTEGGLPGFFSSARYKRDVLKSSSLGLTAVDMRNDSGYVSSLSGDYVLNLGKTWKLTGQFVASVPGKLLPNSAWFVRFANENNVYHFHVRYTELGEHFRENVNQTGYVVDDDRREVDSDLSYRWWFRDGPFRYIDAESRNNVFWARSSGVLRSWYVTEAIEFYFRNRFSLQYSYNNEFKRDDKEYYNYRHKIGLGYNTATYNHARLDYSAGRNFDRMFRRLSLAAQLKLSQRFSASYSGDLIRFDPDPDGHSTLINVLSLNYNFTEDLWLRVFAQNSLSTERIYVYGMAAWRFKPPFGAVYLIYAHDREAELTGLPLRADALFLKLTYPFELLR